MLCGCGSGRKRNLHREHDVDSTYGFLEDEDCTLTAAAVQSESWHPVLTCDQAQYPGRCHAIAHSNQGFDSGVESGTSPESGSQVKLLDMSGSTPVLKFSEKADCSDASAVTSKIYQQYKGQLKMSIYRNSGLLTVHVIEAKHLVSKWSTLPCPFVKVSLVPDDLCKMQCKTPVLTDTTQPIFDEKFSFEVGDDDELTRRVLVSVWSKDPNHNHSELLGCMSFGMQHILQGKSVVAGWYFLLSEQVGRRKHLQAHNKRHLVVDIEEYQSSMSALSNTSLSVTSGMSEFNSSQASSVRTTGPVRVKLCMKKGSSGFGFTLTGGSPARVLEVEAGLPAQLAGLRVRDTIMQINAQVVCRATADTVARIVRFCDELELEVEQQQGGSSSPSPWCSSPSKPAAPPLRPRPSAKAQGSTTLPSRPVCITSKTLAAPSGTYNSTNSKTLPSRPMCISSNTPAAPSGTDNSTNNKTLPSRLYDNRPHVKNPTSGSDYTATKTLPSRPASNGSHVKNFPSGSDYPLTKSKSSQALACEVHAKTIFPGKFVNEPHLQNGVSGKYTCEIHSRPCVSGKSSCGEQSRPSVSGASSCYHTDAWHRFS